MGNKKFSYLNIFKVKFWVSYCCHMRGVICMSNHDYEKAKKFFQKSLEIDVPIGVLGLTYEHLGKCHIDTGEFDKGKSCLLKSLEINTKDVKTNSEISSRLGFIYYMEEDYEKAKYYLENAVSSYKKFHYTDISHAKEYLEKTKEKLSKS